MPRRKKLTPAEAAEVVIHLPGPTITDAAPVVTTEPAASTAASDAQLPAHSPLGGSVVDRFSHCSGSVKLIEMLKTASWYTEDDPEYRREGVEAHALGAWCIENGADCWEVPLEQFPSLTVEMMDGVQMHVTYCRSLPGEHKVEHRVHRPEIHELFYGQLDFAAVARLDDWMEIVDYKHGAGVTVEPHMNPQLRYYAYGLIGEDRDEYPDETVIRLTVVQPRIAHVDGPIRSWDTTARETRQWAREVLLPAMERTMRDRYLSVGEWCRFCPAKLICPAMRNLVTEMAVEHDRDITSDGFMVTQLDNETVGSLYEKWQRAKMLGKAIEQEAQRRLMESEDVPGVKLVASRADRKWKDETPLADTFGADAYKPQETRSPAQIEKLPGGKEFVARWAYVPEGGYTVALANDRRQAVIVKSGAERFAIGVNEAAE